MGASRKSALAHTHITVTARVFFVRVRSMCLWSALRAHILHACACTCLHSMVFDASLALSSCMYAIPCFSFPACICCGRRAAWGACSTPAAPPAVPQQPRRSTPAALCITPAALCIPPAARPQYPSSPPAVPQPLNVSVIPCLHTWHLHLASKPGLYTWHLYLASYTWHLYRSKGQV